MVSLHTVPVAYLHRAVVSLPCPHAAMVSLNIAIVNLHGAIETLLSFLHRRLKRVNRTCTGFFLHVPLQIGARTVHIGKFRGFFLWRRYRQEEVFTIVLLRYRLFHLKRRYHKFATALEVDQTVTSNAH
jgi:hypothetical protein